MAPSAHALLGASNAHRWMECTPSARLCAKLKDTTSTFAQEGTVAHAVAEHYLNCYIRPPQHALPKELTSSEYYNMGMAEYCMTYVNWVMEEYKDILKNHPEALIMSEQRVDYSRYVPEGFGTADVSIIADDLLEIVDYKYGQGVKVDAKNNPQIRLYALGVYLKYFFMYDNISRVKMVIYQPRIDNISVEEMTLQELLAWAESEVKPKAKLAFAGKGELVPGSHCKFCGIKATCRARAEEALELAKYEFAPPATLENAEIAEMLGKVRKLLDWSKDVNSYVLEEALKGTKFEGYKLVAGRGTRSITDMDKAEAALTDAMYFDIYKPKEMLTLTALEKDLGKKVVAEVIGKLITKSEGKPALVPESDKRQEMELHTSVEEDFKEDV